MLSQDSMDTVKEELSEQDSDSEQLPLFPVVSIKTEPDANIVEVGFSLSLLLYWYDCCIRMNALEVSYNTALLAV